MADDPEAVSTLHARGRLPIDESQALRLAADLGPSVSYVRCSALTRVGLKEVFDRAIKAVLVPPPAPARISRSKARTRWLWRALGRC